MQRAHRLAIPFENLDIRLGRGIRIDSESVFAKLVPAKRGGYCFEQNRLFLDALTALGFNARALLARVWLGASETPGHTHMLLLVTIDGREWIADAGFGGGTSQRLAEAVATFGLIGTIISTQRSRPEFTPMAVGLYITAALLVHGVDVVRQSRVTVARSLSGTFAGIAPASVPMFLA